GSPPIRFSNAPSESLSSAALKTSKTRCASWGENSSYSKCVAVWSFRAPSRRNTQRSMPWAPICFAVAINSGRVKRSNAELMTHIGLFGLSMSFVYRFRKIFAKKKGCRSGQPSYSVNTLTHILFCVFSFLYFQANRLSKVLHILKSFSYPGTGSVIAFIEEFVSIPFQALD